MDAFNLTKDAEIFRMALKTYYKNWKGEGEVQLLREEVAEMKKKIEEIKE